MGIDSWNSGPALPKALVSPAGVSSSSMDSFYIVGGSESNGAKSRSIFRLECSNGVCEPWITMEQELTNGRHAPTAMLIPDSKTNC